jgi:tetratricopeptide (TPR) repeat protein/predicted amidohydrolase
MGNAYSMKGELPTAVECQERSLAIREELGLNRAVLDSLINLGTLHQLKGHLERALQYYRRGLAIGEEVGTRLGIALALGNMGEVYRLKGELERALEYYQRSLSIYDELGTREDIARMLGNIGETHRHMGNPTRALEYYQRCVALSEETPDHPWTAGVRRRLVSVALESNDRALAQEQLDNLQRLNERSDNRIIDQNYRVARALLLKTSKRARHKVEAQEILEELVEEDVAYHALTVTAMIHLCDLLLSELKMTGEEEVLVEVKSLTNRLHDIATQQSSHSLLAETYLLQSKLALMELDVGRARELLVQAHSIADERGLERLAGAVAREQDLLQSQLHRWEAVVQENPPKRDMIDLTGIDGLLERMVQKTVATMVQDGRGLLDREAPRGRYRLVHQDLLRGTSRAERSRFRVGVAQIGLSRTGEILEEFYAEQAPGLFRLREDMVEAVRSKLSEMVERAAAEDVNILVFPELTIDLSYERLRDAVESLARTHNMHLIPGSYHDHGTKRNVSTIVSPGGVLWEQAKHIPAVIRLGGKILTEGIAVDDATREITVGRTEFGRIAIVICRDFLDMDLRVELKNCEPPVDLLINPAFTPVTADFSAAHFDARRSVFAYCFFANIAEFGDSHICTPEKERTERNIPPKEENLIYKDVDLFRLRSERKRWEVERAKRRAFIQSTRQH